MKPIIFAAVAVALLASASSIAAKHHHRKHHTFNERFAGVHAHASFIERFAPVRPPGDRYKGEYFGRYYLGDDPDINVRFELRRDYARGLN